MAEDEPEAVLSAEEWERLQKMAAVWKAWEDSFAPLPVGEGTVLHIPRLGRSAPPTEPGDGEE